MVSIRIHVDSTSIYIYIYRYKHRVIAPPLDRVIDIQKQRRIDSSINDMKESHGKKYQRHHLSKIAPYKTFITVHISDIYLSSIYIYIYIQIMNRQPDTRGLDDGQPTLRSFAGTLMLAVALPTTWCCSMLANTTKRKDAMVPSP